MMTLEQAHFFCLDGEPAACRRYGNGHINETYLLESTAGKRYILQKINANVFRDPEAVMRNVAAVTTHLHRTVSDPREALALIPAKDGGLWAVDAAGEYWRVYDFVPDTICLEQAESAADFRESALAFGRFQRQLSDFDAAVLTETIPRFHDTPNRYAHLQQTLAADPCGRAREAEREIEFALSREALAPALTSLLASGDLPLRVTHNDTKLNNVLLDKTTRKALCVVDLDTVMPGLVSYDFGDSIRFGASTAVEDERDLAKVGFSLDLFSSYADGFLTACGDSLTRTELETLRDGARVITLECGVRFLDDFLSGDSYFHTDRPGQNLDRARTQFKLVEEMDRRWEEMQRIILQDK